MNFTTVQEKIITTNESHVLVNSAAASGKTQTLVGRIKYDGKRSTYLTK